MRVSVRACSTPRCMSSQGRVSRIASFVLPNTTILINKASEPQVVITVSALSFSLAHGIMGSFTDVPGSQRKVRSRHGLSTAAGGCPVYLTVVSTNNPASPPCQSDRPMLQAYRKWNFGVSMPCFAEFALFAVWRSQMFEEIVLTSRVLPHAECGEKKNSR